MESGTTLTAKIKTVNSMVQPYNMPIGDALLFYRTQKGWGQDGMSVTLHISRPRYSLLENGKISLSKTIRIKIMIYLPDFHHPDITL